MIARVKEIVVEILQGSILETANYVMELQKKNPNCESIRFEFNSVSFDIRTKIEDPNIIVDKFYEHMPRAVVI